METAVDQWNLTIVPDAETMSETAADLVAKIVAAKPDAVVSVPTGSTPLAMFDLLVERAARGTIDLSRIELFCLDEYVGVSADDPNSLTGWLQRALIDRAGIPPHHVHALPATASDIPAAARRYERELADLGGLDLAILGLGPNGHVAYNEPGSAADSRTRVVKLTPGSVTQAAAYWQSTVNIPDTAVTIGVGTLLEADQIVLLVSGDAKAEILRRTLEEPMSADVPASWLRKAGQRLHVIADEGAASLLGSRRG
jgi:glucosamine-6-phosphate deaminase